MNDAVDVDGTQRCEEVSATELVRRGVVSCYQEVVLTGLGCHVPLDVFFF